MMGTLSLDAPAGRHAEAATTDARPRVAGIHVRLVVGTETYAIPVEHVRELTALDDVTRVPGTPRELIGVWNLRGQVLPVVDPAILLGIPSRGRARWLLVVDVDGRRAGLAVDDIVDVGMLDAELRSTESDLVPLAGFVDDVLVGILDLRRLYAMLEARGSR